MDQHDQNSDAGAGAVFIESDRMGVETQKLYDFLTSRVIGQERAARYIARGAALFRANLRKKKKALVRGALLFAGPPGVGKTMMAEELSKYLVADIEDAPLNRIQCGRLTEKHYISQLLASSHSQVGEMIGEIKDRYRCGACNGAKCGHTMCCQALSDILEKLK